MQGGQDSLDLTVTQLGETHLISLRGELDLAGAEYVRARIEEIAGSTVVLNLGGLSFIDAAGVRALVTAKQRVEARGHSVSIINPTHPVRRVFDLTDTSDYLLGRTRP